MFLRHALTCFLLTLFVTSLAVAAPPEKKIPVTTASTEALQSFREGQLLVDNLRLTDALPHFEKALSLDPDFALAHLYAAQSATNAKTFFEHMDRAAQLATNASRGEQLWITGARAGAYGDAASQRTLFKELAAAFPGDERALTLLGLSYFAQQEWQEAVTFLKKATTVNPDFAPAYNQLGYAYRFLNRYAEAEKTFSRYTQLIPDDPNPYDSYAELLLKMGRFDDAILQYRKALSANAQFANSFAGIAAALAYQGNYEEATKETEKALASARNDGERRAAMFTMAVISMDAGQGERALEWIGKQYDVAHAINDAAAMAGDLVLKGNVHLNAGNAEEALKCYQGALDLISHADLAPQVKENASLIYHYNAGRAAVVRGDLPTAEAEAGKLLTGAEAKNNANQVRLAHEVAGMIALARKEFAKAAEELSRANQQDPANLYRLAQALQGQGKTSEARKAAEQAARFNALPAMNYAFVRVKAERLLSTL